MTVKRSKLTVIMFVFVMAGAMPAYSQSDFMLVSGTTMTADERQQEIFQEVKACMEMNDVRVIQSKKYDVVKLWGEKEVENERIISLSFNKETGVYVAMSQPNTRSPRFKKEIKGEFKKERKSKEQPEWSVIFDKAQNCLARENMLAIETKDVDILQMWIKEDEEGRNISINFNAETGIYTAVSTPKTDGNGGVRILSK